MNSTLMRGRALVALLGSLALASASQAQSPNGDDIQQTVVRLAYFSGEVSYSRGDDPDDWQPASLNFPMTLGDRLYTTRGSRLELQTEGGAIYLAPETDLAALNLTYDVKQFSLGIGSASFRIRHIGSGESFEVDTPNAAVTFAGAGEYRIDVDRDGNTRVIVNRGHAYVAAAGGEVPLDAGRLMAIDGIDSPVYDITSLPRRDSWDQWVATRSRPSPATGSRRYVSANISGVDDLDQYGRWSQIPEYGTVLEPGERVCRLAALPRRTLGLAGPLGLELGLDRVVGVGSLSLRTLGHVASHAGTGYRSGRTCTRFVTRRRSSRSSAGPASLSPSRSAEAGTSAGSRWRPVTRSFRGGARGPAKRTSQTSRMSPT